MSELNDFIFFKQNQLANVDFTTGVIDVYKTAVIGNRKSKDFGKKVKYIKKNIGSKNQDGYIRVWCNGTLRMKHRLLYWLHTGNLPDEIDHINGIRDDNSISNLRNVTRKQQLQNIKNPAKFRRFSQQELHDICSYIVKGINDTQIAKLMNCSRTAVMGIRTKYRHKEFSDAYF